MKYLHAAFAVAVTFMLTCGSGPAGAIPAFGISNYASSQSKIPGAIPELPVDVCNSGANVCSAITAYARAGDNINLGLASGSVYAYSTGDAGGIDATVDGYWWDTITVTSNTLAAGTAVTLMGSVELSAQVSPSLAYPSPHTRAQASLNFGGPSCCSIADTRTDTVTSATGSFQAVVGGSYQVFGSLIAHTGTNAFVADTGSVEASARYYLWTSTPGAGYISASGVNYAPPVPEPETYGLMLAGLGLMGLMIRRRKHSHP